MSSQISGGTASLDQLTRDEKTLMVSAVEPLAEKHYFAVYLTFYAVGFSAALTQIFHTPIKPVNGQYSGCSSAR